MVRVCITAWLLAALAAGGRAQAFVREHLFLSPSLTVGYTFGARVCYGVDIGVGYKTTDRWGSEYRAGISVSQYFVEAKHHLARVSTASVLFLKDFIDLKAGIGRVRNKWGYQNRNTSAVYGFCYDASLRLPSQIHNTWFGIRHFMYRPGDWPWFEIPYTSLYLKYRYDFPRIQPAKRPAYGNGTGFAP